jgi:biotin carboxyl carrier protein
MSCKQDEARPPCRADERGRETPPAGAPPLDRRMARLEVMTRGDLRLDAVVEGWLDDVLWVRVGGSRVPLRWLRVDGTCGFALPSGRVVVPTVGPATHATEILVGGQSLFVGPARAAATRAAARPGSGIAEVAARMDGRVVRVPVRPGQPVEPGQPLVILEAMKMEDALRSPVRATVREVRAHEGDRVRRDQVLVVLDPAADSR